MQLDPLAAAQRPGQLSLGLLHPQPHVVGDRANSAPGERLFQRLDPGSGWRRRRVRVPEHAGPGQRRIRTRGDAGQVGEQAADGLGRIGLVGADHAGRTALEPPGHVLAGQWAPVRAEHPPGGVRHDGVALVERDAVQRDALIADRPEHQLRVKGLQFPSALERTAPVEAGALQHDPGDPVGAGNLHRPQPEPDGERPLGTVLRPAGGLRTLPGCRAVSALPRRPFPDHDHVAADTAVRLGERRALAGPVEGVRVGLGGRDDDLDAGQLTQLTQLLGGELGVRGAAPPDHVHLTNLAGLQSLQHRLGHVGAVQVGRVPGQDPGHIHRDVPDADDRNRLSVQNERAGPDVRVPAVPVDEVGGRVAARQVLARNAEPPVPHRPGRVDHRVVSRQQVVAGHILAQVHAAEKPDVGAFQHPAQVLGDRLDRLVVGGHPVPDQAVGRGQPIVDIHPDPHRPVRPFERGRMLDQRLRRVQPGRTGPDDRDLQHLHALHPRRLLCLGILARGVGSRQISFG